MLGNFQLRGLSVKLAIPSEIAIEAIDKDKFNWNAETGPIHTGGTSYISFLGTSGSLNKGGMRP